MELRAFEDAKETYGEDIAFEPCVYVARYNRKAKLFHASRGLIMSVERYAKDADSISVVVPGPRVIREHIESRYSGRKGEFITEDGWYPYGLLGPDVAHLARLQRTFYEGDLPLATVQALRRWDDSLAHLELLWNRGATIQAISELSGKTKDQVTGKVEAMRHMGFDMPVRKARK